MLGVAILASLGGGGAFARGGDAGQGKIKAREAAPGQRLKLTVLKTPPKLKPGQGKLELGEGRIRAKVEGPFKRNPKHRAIVDLGNFGKLDAKGRSHSRKGRPHPTLRAPQSRAAANDLVLFRNQTVTDNARDSTTAEPSVGNDRNAVLFTGNWFTSFSSDNGVSWQYVSPYNLTPPSELDIASGEEDEAFCCDQVVNASDEDGEELITWVLQYDNDGDKNAIRIAWYEGRTDLLASHSSLSPCVQDFYPDDFELPGNRELDFNVLENSDEWLYVTSNVYAISSENAKGYVLWRIKLDDMTDGDCSLEHGFEYIYEEDYQTARLVNGAGSTMYWAVHDPMGKKMRLYKLADSSDTYSWDRKNVTNWSADGYTCPRASRDPCENGDGRILAGWKGDGEVGWLWMAGEGGDFDWPYIRGARFKTSDFSRIEEIELWSDDYAVAYPSVGVSNGDIGVLYYRMGGSYHPSPRVFIIDSVTSDWGNIETTGIVTGNYSPKKDRWGDYGRVARYDGCSNTFLASAYSLAAGQSDGDAQVRMVWFGREKYGCPDLIVESFAYAYSSTLEKLLIADTTRNVGGVEAGTTSETRFYLSKDDDYDSSDLRIYVDPEHDVPDLDDGDDSPLLTIGPVPSGAKSSESYYVLACADATERVEEVSDSNNCAVEDDKFTVPATTPTISKKDLSMFVVNADARPQFQPGGPIKITDDVRISADDAVPAVVRYYLSATRFLDDTRIELGMREIPNWDKLPTPPKPTPIPVWKSVKITNLTIPKTVQPGVYFVVACVEPKTALAEKSATNNCRATVSFRVFPPR